MYLFAKCLTRTHIRRQLRERADLTMIKSEAENGEPQVAREVLIRARTVADTERVRRTLLPPILVLTFLQIRMNWAIVERQLSTSLYHPLPNPHKVPSCST